jgi:hypothetical protein
MDYRSYLIKNGVYNVTGRDSRYYNYITFGIPRESKTECNIY